MKKYRKIGTTVMLMSIVIATVITLALGILIKVSLNKVANRSLKTMEERMRADYDEMIKGAGSGGNYYDRAYKGNGRFRTAYGG